MTRGEGGWLLLPSAGLSPAILRQFAWRTPAGAVQRRTHRPSARPRPAPADHRDAARPESRSFPRPSGFRRRPRRRTPPALPHRHAPGSRGSPGRRLPCPNADRRPRRPDGLGRARRTVPPPMDATGRKTAGRPAPTTASSTVEATRVRPGICQTNPRRASETAASRASRLISGSCLPGK